MTADDIKREIMTKITVPVPVAGAAIGLGRNAAYGEAAKTGKIAGVAIIEAGKKKSVPTAPLRRVLGLELA